MTFSTLGTMASYVPKQGVTGTVDLSTATVVKGAGMDLIVPTSVAGSGVTLSGGEVTFSAATEVDVNGCFTTTYDNYLVDIRYSSSAATFLPFRLRAAGSNVATSTYAWTMAQIAIGGVSYETGSASATSIHTNYTGLGKDAGHTIRVMSPALAEETLLINDASSFGSYIYRYAGNGLNTNATAYDGFALIPVSGNISGKLRVYGLRNS